MLTKEEAAAFAVGDRVEWKPVTTRKYHSSWTIVPKSVESGIKNLRSKGHDARLPIPESGEGGELIFRFVGYILRQ